MYPKGALTHHLLKQAVVSLPLVGHVRSPRGIASPAGAAGQGCIFYKLPALPTQSAQGLPFWNPLFMGWQYTTPSRRLPAQTCHRQLCRRYRGETNRSTPVWLGVVIHDALFRKSGEQFQNHFRKDKVIYGDLSFGGQDGQPGRGPLRRSRFSLSELFPDTHRLRWGAA